MGAFTKKYSKQQFMKAAMENGWLFESDIRMLDLMYDFAQEHDFEDVDSLMEELMSTSCEVVDERYNVEDRIEQVFSKHFSQIPHEDGPDAELYELAVNPREMLNQYTLMTLFRQKQQIIDDTMRKLSGITVQPEGPGKADVNLQEKNAPQQINMDQLAAAQNDKQRQEDKDRKDLQKWTGLSAEKKESAREFMDYISARGKSKWKDIVFVSIGNLYDTPEWNSTQEIKQGATHVRNLVNGLSQMLMDSSVKPNSQQREKALDLLYDLDPVLAKDKEETLTRENMVKGRNVVNLDQKYGEIAPGFKVANQHYRLLPDNMNKILSFGDNLQDLANMFFTRKTGVFFTSDTNTYTQAKNALVDFIAERNRLQGEIDGLSQQLADGEISEKDFKRQAKEKMDGSRLGELKNTLMEKMHAYAVHATDGKDGVMGTKKVEKVRKSAGQARYTASMSILDLVEKAFAENQPDRNQELLRDDNKIKETTYQKIYLEKYKTLTEGTEEEKRIIAGRHAQNELDRRIKNNEIDAPQMKMD